MEAVTVGSVLTKEQLFRAHYRAARVAGVDPAVALSGFNANTPPPKQPREIIRQCKGCGKRISENKTECFKCNRHGY